MRKIPTLFLRDPENRDRLLREYDPNCAWVPAGEGYATLKVDGTCVMLDSDGLWYTRREVKAGKTAPANFLVAADDPITGKVVGWEPMHQSGWRKPLLEAIANHGEFEENEHGKTYELVGPKVNGNPHQVLEHQVWLHGQPLPAALVPRTYDELAGYLATLPFEGIVWWHPWGYRAKIKRRDFGLPWPLVDVDTEIPQDALTN